MWHARGFLVIIIAFNFCTFFRSCFEGYAETDNECPICAPENRLVRFSFRYVLWHCAWPLNLILFLPLLGPLPNFQGWNQKWPWSLCPRGKTQTLPSPFSRITSPLPLPPSHIPPLPPLPYSSLLQDSHVYNKQGFIFYRRKVLDIIRQQEQAKDLHEQFHHQVKEEFPQG